MEGNNVLMDGGASPLSITDDIWDNTARTFLFGSYSTSTYTVDDCVKDILLNKIPSMKKDFTCTGTFIHGSVYSLLIQTCTATFPNETYNSALLFSYTGSATITLYQNLKGTVTKTVFTGERTTI